MRDGCVVRVGCVVRDVSVMGEGWDWLGRAITGVSLAGNG